MKIVIGSDHCGYPMKHAVRSVVESLGFEVVDCGCHSEAPVDFPDIARLVCRTALEDDQVFRSIMVCGTGVGAAIAANKIPGIRAAVCHDTYSAHQSVEHDDVNVLCIGAQIIGPWLAKDIITAFLTASFSTEEHFQRRVRKLNEMDQINGS